MKLTIHGYQNKSENKYYNWYTNIIENRLKNPINGYTESHHILPKSLGGSDDVTNLVKLSSKEHFIVHQLLPRFISGRGHYKMIKAAQCMFMKSKYTDVRYINSNLYAYIKPKIANATRQYMIKYSPFKNPIIHAKTMKTRELNGTNVWSTNNPMKNKERALEIASKRSGENHYSRNTLYFYSSDRINWIKINIKTTLTDALNDLGFSYPSYMKMLSNPGFSPSRGVMKGLIGKRETREDS